MVNKTEEACLGLGTNAVRSDAAVELGMVHSSVIPPARRELVNNGRTALVTDDFNVAERNVQHAS